VRIFARRRRRVGYGHFPGRRGTIGPLRTTADSCLANARTSGNDTSNALRRQRKSAPALRCGNRWANPSSFGLTPLPGCPRGRQRNAVPAGALGRRVAAEPAIAGGLQGDAFVAASAIPPRSDGTRSRRDHRRPDARLRPWPFRRRCGPILRRLASLVSPGSTGGVSSTSGKTRPGARSGSGSQPEPTSSSCHLAILQMIDELRSTDTPGLAHRPEDASLGDAAEIALDRGRPAGRHVEIDDLGDRRGRSRAACGCRVHTPR
jgi:hypothetical protein